MLSQRSVRRGVQIVQGAEMRTESGDPGYMVAEIDGETRLGFILRGTLGLPYIGVVYIV